MVNQNGKVVITGMGALTPIGNYGVMPNGVEVDTFLSGLREGRNGISSLEDRFGEDFPIKVAGQIEEFNPTDYGIDGTEIRKLDRTALLGIAATELAIGDAGIVFGEGNEKVSPGNLGISLGIGVGSANTTYDQAKRHFRGKRLKSQTVPRIMQNSAAAQISIHYGLKGAVDTLSSACASGGSAIRHGCNRLKFENEGIIVVGGLDSCLTPFAFEGFYMMGALSPTTEPIYRVYCKKKRIPRGRGGFVMGEGSGILILESEEHALQRKARIYAEIAGYAETADAMDIAHPDEKGGGLVRAIQSAFEMAGVGPEDIDYVNSHGTGTMNDYIENEVMHKIFGERAESVPISSTKPMIGHLIGGGTSVEIIASVLGMYKHFIHPLINLRNPINDLNYVREVRENVDLKYILKFSSGFGGHNVAFVLKYYEPNIHRAV
ncbi:MAG: beta-ketoacyl-[acyl-carrier-protein] synthase family protein [Nanoarchaeota archaeon]|nr:beta-ketoacyl-[acyl-carrier-protein] synthase family protein [Nanoarchaeota archaeon]